MRRGAGRVFSRTERDVGRKCRKEIVRTEEEKMEKGVSQVPPGEGGKSLRVLGELVTYKITSYQTGGAYSLFEVVTHPAGGPPPHVQHREDEAFYVLEGEYEFVVEGRTMRVGAGSLIYVPRGNLHAHKTVGEEPGRLRSEERRVGKECRSRWSRYH